MSDKISISEVFASGEKITAQEVKIFEETLKEYQTGKQEIDSKATSNQEWWRLRHWGQIGSKHEGEENATSAWLFNSIINKRADIMDAFPKPNILPREENDKSEAETLTKILPVIADRNGYEQIYADKGLDLLVDGGCITSVTWDNSLNDGLGDVSIKQVDIHNIFWQPGINDIQESQAIFTPKLVENDLLEQQYPQLKGKSGGIKTTAQYINNDEQVDETKYTEVWDMYYKKTVEEVVHTDIETGERVTRPKAILHYVKFCNGELLYASENDENYKERGWYDHGKYPFVITPLFKIKDSPWGFGYVDVMKSPQAQIDRIDNAILQNAVMASTPRWAVPKNAGINKNDFANWKIPIVDVASEGAIDKIKEITVGSIPAFVVNHKMNLIEQLKETSGNRDVSQGSTQSGVTAASAIAALQEAGGKLARDLNRILYRAKREEDYLQVELIRQFYTEPRSFRIDKEDGTYEFVNYDNSNMGDAVFDIKIEAEKRSPFSRAAQNETVKELYGMGLFAPENATAALVCLEGLEFEGKDQIKRQVQENSIMLQQMQKMQEAIMQASQVLPELPVMAGLVDPMMMQQQVSQQQGANNSDGTPEERAARTESDTTLTTKARLRVAKAGEVS